MRCEGGELAKGTGRIIEKETLTWKLAVEEQNRARIEDEPQRASQGLDTPMKHST